MQQNKYILKSRKGTISYLSLCLALLLIIMQAGCATLRVHGTIEKIFVNEGDRVIAGRTRLFQIDALKLKRNVEMEAQEVSVARYARIEVEANLDRVKADFQKAEIENSLLN